MIKKTVLFSIALLVLIGTIVAIKVVQIRTLISAKQPAQREAVSTALVKREHWQQSLTSVGSLSAVQGVTVAAELDGKIVELDF